MCARNTRTISSWNYQNAKRNAVWLALLGRGRYKNSRLLPSLLLFYILTPTEVITKKATSRTSWLAAAEKEQNSYIMAVVAVCEIIKTSEIAYDVRQPIAATKSTSLNLYVLFSALLLTNLRKSHL